WPNQMFSPGVRIAREENAHHSSAEIHRRKAPRKIPIRQPLERPATARVSPVMPIGIISESPNVQRAMIEMLDAAGISDAKLCQQIREGLDATIVVRNTAYAKREVLIDF